MSVANLTKTITRSATRIVRKPYRSLRISYVLHRRTFQAYVIGMGKSGTSSMAELFRTNYRAAHEPECDKLIDVILAATDGSISPQDLQDYVIARDKRLWLDVDSSQLNYFLLDVLINAFPNSKFILTMRDCYSWLDSFINHQLRELNSPPLHHRIKSRVQWTKLRELRFRKPELAYAVEEKILADHGLYTLDGYLSYWARHNNQVFKTVPRDRLLVVRTHEISRNIDRIASFLNIPAGSLELAKSHANKAEKRFHMLSRLDKDFLEEKVKVHCQDLMNAVFPEIRGFDSFP